MKYKVGDKVCIKSREWYDMNKNRFLDIENTRIKDSLLFTEEMSQYCGKEAKISSYVNQDSGYKLDIDRGYFSWQDWMFEDETLNENKMNEKLDLTKILKDCPKGTKLYSPLVGECIFEEIRAERFFPIITRYLETELAFMADGGYLASPNGDCLLFPSKENRDWSTFKVEKPEKKKPKFKAGDFITDGTFYFLVTGMEYGLRTQKGINSAFTPIAVDKQFHLCSPDEVAMFKKSLHEKGFHWSKSQKKLVYWYRPFERVLVRVGKLMPWRCNVFSHYDRDKEMFVFADGGLLRNEECILPFEGNEKKLGKITE